MSSKRLRVASLICVLLLSFPGMGLAAAPSDSLSASLAGPLRQNAESASAFRPSQLIAPAAFLGSGVAVHCFAHESVDYAIRDRVAVWRGAGPVRDFDDYLQYLPFVTNVGLGLTGVKAKHDLLDRTIETSVSIIALAAMTRGMKWLIDSPRPDGSDSKSFPSGHTGTAFAGAELVRMEYGWGWGAGAYAVATTVAVMRVYNNKHWMSDLLAGCAVGILSAHIGEWLLDPIKGLFNITAPESSSNSMNLSIQPTVDPIDGSVCASLCLVF